MKKHIKLISMLLGCAMATAILSGCGGSDKKEPQKAAEIKFLRIGTASLGGNYFPMGTALALAVEKHVKGYKATSEATGGSVFNITAQEKKELEMGISQGSSVAQVINAKSAPNLRTVLNYNSTPQHILVRTNAGINSIADLKGKKLEMLAAGDGVEVSSKQILEAVGIAWNEVKPEYSGNRVQAASRLKTGQVDAIIDATGLGGAWMVDIVGDGSKFKFLSLSDVDMKKVLDKNKEFNPVKIPANTYKGQSNDVQTISVWTVLTCRADLPTDVVYQITKAIFDEQKFLFERHAYFKDLKAENIKDAIIAPLHPGAEKYYKEKGLVK